MWSIRKISPYSPHGQLMEDEPCDGQWYIPTASLENMTCRIYFFDVLAGGARKKKPVSKQHFNKMGDL